ncbi:MAG: HAMP domain-containing histidine kinase, partial [Candidatus Niameybacter stercoravium]|nr:HAMP domain-containing histidine kinase [Candidatus Niameybacter stercoravium]
MKQNDLFVRTKRNIILSTLSIVLICLITFILVTQYFYRSRLFSGVDQQLLTHRNMILNEEIIKKKGQNEEIIIPAPLTPDLISFVWKGNELVDKSPHTYFGEGHYPDFPKGQEGELITLESKGYTYRAISFEKEGLRIELLLNVDPQILSVKQLERANGLSFMILIGITLALASYLAALVLRPVKKAYNEQVYFVQDASHEMRTPLAVIKGQVELMTAHSGDRIEDHFEGLSQMIGEIRGLEKLNRDLLLLSKEGIEGKAVGEAVELYNFVEDIKEFYTELAELQSKEFILKMSDPHCKIQWDLDKVKRCFTILLENAFKYTEEGDTIQLELTKVNKHVVVHIEDSGMGISKKDQERIFDRFFRSGDVRAKGIEGSGIGLSLLQSLAHTLGIKVQVQSTYGKGTTFT